MKKFVTICAVVMLAAVMVQAESTTWNVATVHGYNQFTINPDGTSLLYHQQGWTDYAWNENNGSASGTIAQGMYGDRTGMKTYATTDAAYGQKLSDLKLVFEYHNTLGGYPSMNFFMTDGLGHYGIFSPASGGIGAVSTQDVLNGWTRMTLDLTKTTISDTARVAVYEHNGLCDEYGVPYTNMTWGDIKNFTIAGMYDYQRSPEGGWDEWGTSFDSTNGLALIWGDTVNSNNSYGSQEREIRNVVLTIGDTNYTGTFVSAQVPVPGAVILGSIGAGLVGWMRRRKSL